jgi:hypothetical protein
VEPDLAGALLDLGPPGTHFDDGTLAHRIAWTGPEAGGGHGGQRGHALAHGLLRIRALGAQLIELACAHQVEAGTLASREH